MRAEIDEIYDARLCMLCSQCIEKIFVSRYFTGLHSIFPKNLSADDLVLSQSPEYCYVIRASSHFPFMYMRKPAELIERKISALLRLLYEHTRVQFSITKLEFVARKIFARTKSIALRFPKKALNENKVSGRDAPKRQLTWKAANHSNETNNERKFIVNRFFISKRSKSVVN